MSGDDAREEVERALGREPEPRPAAPPPQPAQRPVPTEPPAREPAPPRAAPARPGAPPDRALAGWWVRGGAYVIDVLIQAAVILAVLFVVGAVSGEAADSERLVELVFWAVGFPLSLLYAQLLMLRRGERNGQTLGKQMMGIRVVHESRAPIGFGVGVMRHVIGQSLINLLTLSLYMLVDYLWPLRDRHNQAIHDKIAKTYVVRVGAADADGSAGLGAPAPVVTAVEKPSPAQPAPAPPPRDDQPVRGWLPPSAQE